MPPHPPSKPAWVHWQPTEDELIWSYRNQNPPAPDNFIATLINTLPESPGDRTGPEVAQRRSKLLSDDRAAQARAKRAEEQRKKETKQGQKGDNRGRKKSRQANNKTGKKPTGFKKNKRGTMPQIVKIIQKVTNQQPTVKKATARKAKAVVKRQVKDMAYEYLQHAEQEWERQHSHKPLPHIQKPTVQQPQPQPHAQQPFVQQQVQHVELVLHVKQEENDEVYWDVGYGNENVLHQGLGHEIMEINEDFDQLLRKAFEDGGVSSFYGYDFYGIGGLAGIGGLIGNGEFFANGELVENGELVRSEELVNNRELVANSGVVKTGSAEYEISLLLGQDDSGYVSHGEVQDENYMPPLPYI